MHSPCKFEVCRSYVRKSRHLALRLPSPFLKVFLWPSDIWKSTEQKHEDTYGIYFNIYTTAEIEDDTAKIEPVIGARTRAINVLGSAS